MIHPPTTFRLRLAIALCLSVVTATSGRSQTSSATVAGQFANQMEAEVREVAQSDQLPPATRGKRIASMVRMTIAKATSGGTNPADNLDMAIRLAESAVRLVPEHADAIADAVSHAPAVVRIESGPEQIRHAVLNSTGMRGDQSAPVAPRATGSAVKPAKKRQVASADSPAGSTRLDKQEALANRTQVAEPDKNTSWNEDGGPGLILGDNVVFSLLADLGFQYDDNLFLTAENETEDTMISVAPGFGLRFGRASLAQGSLNYRHAFITYAGNSAPSTSLGAGSAQFGFNGSRFSFLSSLSFQQLNQNNRDVAALDEKIYRRDVLDLAVTTETGLSAKTSLGAGINHNRVGYKSGELIGTRQTEIPLNLYLALTPKTSLSGGLSYRRVKPEGDDAGPSGRDMFYNIGARGALAPKLSGQINVGYRTRSVGDNPDEKLWGFDSALNLELSAKSSLSLALNRDFSTGALGESLSGNRYTLRFSANPTSQWSLGTALSYFDTEYGPASYAQNNTTVNLFRHDRYWEVSFLSSYTITRWFTASADYTLRKNSSSLPTAAFSNNLLNLNMGFRY